MVFKMLRRAATWATGLCACLCVAAPAWANGRFPNANQLLVDPEEPAHIVVRSTFGLLQTFDSGANWSWVCEEAVTAQGFRDPEALVMGGGSVVLGLVDGIAYSDPAGCTWSREASGIDGRAVNDLIRHPSAPNRAYASLIVGLDGLYGGQIVTTSDGGRSWSPVGNVLLDTYPVTLEIAASRPERLYLGLNDSSISNGSIGVSDDAGETFVLRAPPAGSDSIYVSAVDPRNPDRVYVRSYYPESNLYVSENGGLTYALLYRSSSALTGFALSPAGDRVAVGDQESIVVLAREGADAGVSTYSMERSFPMNVQCLTWTEAGLYACATEASDGFSVGISSDGAQTFAPLLHFADLRPVTCSAGTSAARCAQSECVLASLFDGSCEGVAPPPEPTPVTPVAADAGTGDAGHGSNPSDSAPDSSVPPETVAARPDTSSPALSSQRASRGCDCELPGSLGSAARGAPWLLAAAGALAARQARRGRKRRLS